MYKICNAILKRIYVVPSRHHSGCNERFHSLKGDTVFLYTIRLLSHHLQKVFLIRNAYTVHCGQAAIPTR